jgi:hypothetical protein
MMGLELAGALVLGVLVLWLVLRPLSRRTAAAPEIDDPIPVEETRRGQALAALTDIEFDHATGKLSDEDYGELRRRHGREALALLEQAPALGAEALVTRRLEAIARGVVCPTCGPRPEPDARFCSTCGRALDEAPAAPRSEDERPGP